MNKLLTLGLIFFATSCNASSTAMSGAALASSIAAMSASNNATAAIKRMENSHNYDYMEHRVCDKVSDYELVVSAITERGFGKLEPIDDDVRGFRIKIQILLNQGFVLQGGLKIIARDSHLFLIQEMVKCADEPQ